MSVGEKNSDKTEFGAGPRGLAESGCLPRSDRPHLPLRSDVTDACYKAGPTTLCQRHDFVQFLGRRQFCLQTWANTFGDFELSTSPSKQLGLKKLLKDVDTGRLDCVVVHTFDRLTDGLISHEELLAKFRQRDVTLMTLCPEFYHVWGKSMEEKWINSMRWYLHETQHRVRESLGARSGSH